METKQTANVLLLMAAAVIVIAGMKAADVIIIRFLLALLVAFIFSPLFFRLNRLGVPQSVSLVIVFLIIVIIGAGLTAVFASAVADFSNSLPIYQENLQNMSDNIMAFLNELGIKTASENMKNIFDPAAIMNLFGALLKSFTGMLSDSVLIMMMVIFMLLEAYSVPLKIKEIWGADSRLLKDIDNFVLGMQRYLYLKTVISLATGLLIGVFMMVIGVDFALLWGLLAFLLNFIPNVGSILAAIPPMILSLFQMGWLPFLEVSFVYLAVNNVIGNFLEPKIMGKGLNLSPFVVFMSVIFWGWVLGPIGMLLSVPLTMAFKMYLESKPDTEWAARLISAAPAAERSRPRLFRRRSA